MTNIDFCPKIMTTNIYFPQFCEEEDKDKNIDYFCCEEEDKHKSIDYFCCEEEEEDKHKNIDYFCCNRMDDDDDTKQ